MKKYNLQVAQVQFIYAAAMLSRVMVFSPIVLSPSCFWSAAGGALSVGGGGMAMLAGGGMAAASAGGRSSV